MSETINGEALKKLQLDALAQYEASKALNDPELEYKLKMKYEALEDSVVIYRLTINKDKHDFNSNN